MPVVLTVDKAIDILEAVAASEAGAGTRDLARQLGLNVATVHNIARTLEARGYLRQVSDTKRFVPGLRLMLLSRHDQYLETIASVGRPEIDRLAAALEESVMLAVLDRGRVANLHYVPSRQALRVHEPEDVGPIAYCTAFGKLMLAQMSPQQLDAYLQQTPLKAFTDRTICTRETLLAALEQVRQQGYSTAQDELCEGVSAVAVPVVDPAGRPIAAIGASAPTVRMETAAQREAMRKALQAGAERIEQGWAKQTNRRASKPRA